MTALLNIDQSKSTYGTQDKNECTPFKSSVDSMCDWVRVWLAKYLYVAIVSLTPSQTFNFLTIVYTLTLTFT